MSTPSVSYTQIISRLHEQGLALAETAQPTGLRLIITALGGRIFAFLPGQDDCLFWVNAVFTNADAFAGFVARREWNLGGDRVWIGPEIQFIVRQRGDSEGGPVGVVPENMDPGDFRLECRGPAAWLLSQTSTLSAYCIGTGQVTIGLEREVELLGDPLAGMGLSDGLFCGGYQQRIHMTHMGPGEAQASWWSVTNLRPGGDVFIATTPGVRYANFNSPVPLALHEIGSDFVRARLTGNVQYKTGYTAAHVLGRFGYLNQKDRDLAYLLVRAFYSQPSGRYLEEPVEQPGCHGHSAFIYNDDGRYGGFGEFECMGSAIGPASASGSCQESLPLWIYAGEPDRLRAVARALMGVEI